MRRGAWWYLGEAELHGDDTEGRDVEGDGERALGRRELYRVRRAQLGHTGHPAVRQPVQVYIHSALNKHRSEEGTHSFMAWIWDSVG